jgi:hypothetical protein
MAAERNIKRKACLHMRGPRWGWGHHVPTRFGGTNLPAASPTALRIFNCTTLQSYHEKVRRASRQLSNRASLE